jgi:hypothetical protein
MPITESTRKTGDREMDTDMGAASLEHVNVTLSARETADLMVSVFGWRVRWEGPAKSGGHTIHVGTEDTYVALYTPPAGILQAEREGQPNHVGVLVGDLAATETRIRAAGYRPYAHADYAAAGSSSKW